MAQVLHRYWSEGNIREMNVFGFKVQCVFRLPGRVEGARFVAKEKDRNAKRMRGFVLLGKSGLGVKFLIVEPKCFPHS